MLLTFDHCAIHVSDWERSNAFYTTVLGDELMARPVGLRLPVRRPPAQCPRSGRDRPRSAFPAAPGNSDLCFEWRGRSRTPSPISDAAGSPSSAARCGGSAPRARAPASISAILTAR